MSEVQTPQLAEPGLPELMARIAKKPYYVVFLDATERWSTDDEEAPVRLHAHLLYLRQLERENRLVMAGPLNWVEDGSWDGNGMLVLRADSLDHAREIAEQEPLHRAGVRSNRVVPWQVNEGSMTLTVRLLDQSADFT